MVVYKWVLMNVLLRNVSIVLVLTLFYCTTLFAKNEGRQKIDSLFKEIKAAQTDTDKVTLYIALSLEYNYINADTGIQLGKQASSLAQKVTWKKGLSKAHNAIGLNYESKSEDDSAINNYTKALSINETIKDKKQIANTLGNIASAYYHLGNFQKALEANKKALLISDEIGNYSIKVSTLCNIGDIYLSISRYPEALDNYIKALRLDETMRDSAGIATELSNIGLVYHYQNNYPKAFDYYTKALIMCTQLGDKKGMAANYANLGIIYGLKGNFPMGLDYQLKAKILHIELGDKGNIANDLSNMGNIYSRMGNWNKTLECLNQSMKLSEELGNLRNVAICLGNIGEAYLSIAKTLKENPVCSKIDYYSFTANLQTAIIYLNKGVSACMQINDLRNLAMFYKALSEAHELAGNYKEGLASQKKYIRYNDSVFSIKNQEMLANIEKEREMELTEKKLQIKNLEISNKKRDIVIFILIILFLVITTLWAWKNFRTVKNTNLILTEEKKHHIEQIEEQNKILLDIAYTQSHNVRGPVSTILGLVQHYNYEYPADPNNTELIEGVALVSKKLDEIVRDVVYKINELDKGKT